MKKLLITADDYGVHPVINQGIEKCIDAGVIDCVDVIVTHHQSRKYIRRLLKKYKAKFKSGELRLGLHLTLTCGSPQYRGDRKYLRAISMVRRGDVIKRREFRFNSGRQFIPKFDNLLRQHKTSLEKEIYAQYDTFLKITNEVIHDLKPYHVSSHLGVYTMNDIFYQMLKKFCVAKEVDMRCPTLISLNNQASMKVWKENPEQQMFKLSLLSWAWAMDNGLKLKNWMTKDLKNTFDADTKQGAILSTDFFVEHFFKQGSEKLMKTILSRLKDDHFYELVVHPVWFTNRHQYRNLPRGIKKKGFAQRRSECFALVKMDLPALLKQYGVVRVGDAHEIV